MTYIQRQTKDGFTIIEILIVVGIIGLLVAILAPRYFGKREQATKQLAQIGLENVKGAIDLYHLSVGRYPDRLEDLVDKPQDERAAKKWQGPYLKDIPEDPWGQDYEYRKTAGGQHPYELYSDGPEGGEPISVWDI